MGIYIWGTGCTAGGIFDQDLELSRITAFIDNFPSQKSFLGKPVVTPDQLSIDDIELILVTSRYTESIRNQCLSLGIRPEVLYFLKNNYKLYDYNESCKNAETLLGTAFYRNIKHNCHIVREPLGCPDQLPNSNETEADYIRTKTLELLAHSISDISGSIAELGVYRGNFARLMNQLLPNRKLYLFDTFEGFDMKEAVKEKQIASFGDSFLEAHKNTGVAQVLRTMPHPESIIIHQGYFPESLHNLEETFALVSLDVDFEDTTYEGLVYFWPRLTSGGYLMLHDYNSPNLKGVKLAVKRYEEAFQVRLPGIPLCDMNGTLILCKP